MCVIVQDPKIQLLAMSFRQAEVFGFSNGMCKSIATKLMDVVLNHTLCPEHQVSVFWYVISLKTLGITHTFRGVDGVGENCLI
jgi:hypothetical protein